MKKIIILSALILLFISLCACAEPSGTTVRLEVTDEQNALYMYNYYRFTGKQADNLLAYLETLDYSGERCDCYPTHHLYVGDDEYASYGIMLSEEEFYITHDGGQTVGLTPEQRAKVEGLLSFIEHKDNLLPIEEEKYAVNVSRREGDQYRRYSFHNEDSVQLLTLIHTLEYTETDTCRDTDVKFDISEWGNFRFSLQDGDSPCIFKNGKMTAAPTAEQAASIHEILERNCTAENEAPMPFAGKPVYITDLARGEQYQPPKGEPATVMSLLDSLIPRYESYDYIHPTFTKATYKIHYDTEISGLRRFYVYFEDEIAHIHSAENSHIALSAKDSALIRNALEEYCKEDLRITDKDKLSDMGL